MIGTNLKTILIVVGIVMSAIGILTDSWKVATVGNSVALVGILIG